MHDKLWSWHRRSGLLGVGRQRSGAKPIDGEREADPMLFDLYMQIDGRKPRRSDLESIQECAMVRTHRVPRGSEPSRVRMLADLQPTKQRDRFEHE